MKIMFVDDEDIIHRSMASMLVHFGHEVVSVYNGAEALRELREVSPELIISDICMPEVSGIELAAQLNVCAPEVPIVLITGNADAQTAVDALHYGVYDYLQKPVKLEAMIALLERVENERAMQRELMGNEEVSSPDNLLQGIAAEIGWTAVELKDCLPSINEKDISGIGYLNECCERIERAAAQMLLVTTADSDREAQLRTALTCALQRVGMSIDDSIADFCIACREGELVEILAQLLANAAQAIEGRVDGRVSVSAISHAVEWVTIWVEDNGEGMNSNTIERAFGAFFTTRDARRHSGVGLALCQFFAERNGGNIGISARPGGGCRVWVRLPLCMRETETH